MIALHAACPCELRRWKNKRDPFPGRMWKATKPTSHLLSVFCHLRYGRFDCVVLGLALVEFWFSGK